MKATSVLTLTALILTLSGRLPAQEEARPRTSKESRQALIHAGLKKARLGLVEAVLRATHRIPGDVIAARLKVEREKDGLEVEYIVLILSGKGIFEVEVDAVSGKITEVESRGSREHAEHAEHAEKAEHARASHEAKFTFEDALAGRLPGDWIPGETRSAGTPGTWLIQRQKGAPSGRQVLSLVETRNTGSTFNLLLSRKVYPADLELSVMLRARTGREDQGGGLVWRAHDASNYYVVRWNPLEDNLRAYKVVKGMRTQLKGLYLKVDPKTWHELKVTCRGSRITVSFDDRKLLVLDDTTFRKRGHVGFWTKADAATSFDDLEVESEQD